jgi:hypothetical protein
MAGELRARAQQRHLFFVNDAQQQDTPEGPACSSRTHPMHSPPPPYLGFDKVKCVGQQKWLQKELTWLQMESLEVVENELKTLKVAPNSTLVPMRL